LPPGLEYEKLSIGQEIKSNSFDFGFKKREKFFKKRSHNLQFKVLKSLKNNSFLQMILNERNGQWKTELFQIIEKDNAHVTNDQNNLIITCSSSSFENEKDWSSHINSIISDYFNQFHLEIIEYSLANLNPIDDLMKSIDAIRKLYLLDYINRKDTCKISIMGRKEHVKDFFDRNKSFQSMTKLYANDQADFETIKGSIVKIPFLKNESKIYGKNSLISVALKKIQEIYDVDYAFTANEQQIELNGLKKRVEDVKKLLEKNLVNIKCKKVNVNEMSILNAIATRHNLTSIKNSLNTIVNEFLCINKSIYKLSFQINNDEFEGESSRNDAIEIYITFFYNFVELKSIDDGVYEEISQLIIDNLSAFALDVTNYSDFILTKIWKDFEVENLSNKVIGKHVYYSLINSHGQTQMLLVGIKENLNLLKSKIQLFLKNNQFKTITISLNEDDVNLDLYKHFLLCLILIIFFFVIK
jgi:hypothetical protein